MAPDLERCWRARRGADHRRHRAVPRSERQAARRTIQKIDLGELWTRSTGLPFVYAFWAGLAGACTPDDVAALQRARDEGVRTPTRSRARTIRTTPSGRLWRRATCAIIFGYVLGHEELEGLRTFYTYAAELGLVAFDGTLRFYHAEHHSAR
jgi:hypothetical protein